MTFRTKESYIHEGRTAGLNGGPPNSLLQPSSWQCKAYMKGYEEGRAARRPGILVGYQAAVAMGTSRTHQAAQEAPSSGAGRGMAQDDRRRASPGPLPPHFWMWPEGTVSHLMFLRTGAEDAEMPTQRHNRFIRAIERIEARWKKRNQAQA